MKVLTSLKFSLSLCALQGFLISCASTTVLETQPSGAKVYINDFYVGTTPIQYSDSKISGSTTNLLFKKDGCQEKEIVLKRNEDFNFGPFFAGFISIAPWFWVMGYDPSHQYPLTCESLEKAELQNSTL